MAGESPPTSWYLASARPFFVHQCKLLNLFPLLLVLRCQSGYGTATTCQAPRLFCVDRCLIGGRGASDFIAQLHTLSTNGLKMDADCPVPRVDDERRVPEATWVQVQSHARTGCACCTLVLAIADATEFRGKDYTVRCEWSRGTITMWISTDHHAMVAWDVFVEEGEPLYPCVPRGRCCH